jgi:Na+/H+ antiporter 1
MPKDNAFHLETIDRISTIGFRHLKNWCPFVVKRIQLTTFQRFFRTETVGVSVLLLFAIAALAVANSPLANVYEQLWQIPLTVGVVDHSLTLHQWKSVVSFSIGSA